MPVFDTMITTDDTNLKKVLSQKLPVVLYLYDRPDARLDKALNAAARDHAGEILVTRIDVSSNPQTYAQYDRPQLPALMTLDDGEIESRAQNIRPADVEDHVQMKCVARSSGSPSHRYATRCPPSAAP